MYENDIYSNSYESNNGNGSNSGNDNGLGGSNSGNNSTMDSSSGGSNSMGGSYSTMDSNVGGSNSMGSSYSGSNSGMNSSYGGSNSMGGSNSGNNSGMGSSYSGNNNNIGGSVYSGVRNDSSVGNDNRGASPYFDYTAYPTGSTVMVTEDKKKKKKEKKAKKPITGVGKVALSAGLGLCFGLFAGAGFYGVKLGTEHFLQANESNLQMDQGQTPDIEEMLNSADINAILNSDAFTNAMLSGSGGLLQAGRLSYVTSDVSEVVEDVMPAMVTILNTYTVTGTSIWGQTYSQQQQGGGSGIIVSENDSELLIVTNNHVVEGADELQVTFSDGSTAKASIKGLDADMDLAVIAVNLKDISSETRGAITIATLGDSESLKLGEPVIAIGNALGYGQSVTTGIVSALNREMTMDDGSVGIFIQTDAAINEGNSGGALLNIKGEVIGINSSKIGGSKVDNVGFAIPISSASPIISELMERKTRVKVAESDKGYLGIEMLAQEVPEEIMALYGIPQGVYIAAVQEGCAAEKAGIIQRDVVTKIDGVRVTSRVELQKEMEYHAAGDTITVTVKRLENGEYATYDLEVTLGKRP